MKSLIDTAIETLNENEIVEAMALSNEISAEMSHAQYTVRC